MTDDKVYTPETIEDTPLPTQDSISTAESSGSGSNDTNSPQTIKDQTTPRRIIAQELISTHINTATRKILSQFTFTPSGAIRIGDYKEGEHGDISISPTGILGRDVFGETTFAIDGETGNATFRGTIIAGDVRIIDNSGLISLSNFSTTESKQSALNQQINTTFSTWTTITGSAITFKLERPITAIVQFSSSFYLTRNDSNDFSGDIFIDAFLDDVEIGSQANRILANAVYSNGGGSDVRAFGPADAVTTLSNMHIITIPEGTHTLDLRATKSNSTSNSLINIYSYSLKYLTLGS